MKKIITLITMFVLSAGCLMAQGVFTYQAVVYDGTSLVVDQDVTAAVTITDGTHNFTQTLPPADNADYPSIHTSLNGLAVLPIGDIEDEDFMAMDWSKATIKVDFTVLGENSATINGTAEQIPAVPYALQANAKITTPMVVDYISHATMDDVMAILEATEKNKDAEHNNVTLHDTVLHAIIDSIMAHYDLVKDIMMSYIADADAQDVDQLFTAMTGNDALMEALATIVKSNLMTPEGKAMIYEVLVDYASRLTDGDVNAILNAIPTDARNEAISKALAFFLDHTVSIDDQDPLTINYKDEDIHAALEEIAKYYIEHISVSQVNTLITTIEGNEGAMDILVPQFYAWMDEYVKKVVNEYLAERYYLCEDGAFDLCEVWNELNGSVDNCLTVNSNTFNFEYSDGIYVGVLDCTTGTAFQNVSDGSTISIDGSYLTGGYAIYDEASKIYVQISPDVFGTNLPTSFTASIHLEVICDDEYTYDFTGSYTEPGEVIEPGQEGGSNCNNPFHIDGTSTEFTLLPADGEYYTATINYTGETPNAISGVYLSYGQINNQTVNENDVILDGDGSVLTVRINHVPYSGDNTNGYLVPSPSSLAPGESFTVELTLHDVCGGYGTTVSFTYTKPQN